MTQVLNVHIGQIYLLVEHLLTTYNVHNTLNGVTLHEYFYSSQMLGVFLNTSNTAPACVGHQLWWNWFVSLCCRPAACIPWCLETDDSFQRMKSLWTTTGSRRR